jgi:hypothetical protein
MRKSIFPILAVLMVCGCSMAGISGGPVLGGGNGLEIMSFTAEPSPVFSGSTVRLIMEVENRGGSNVADGQSLLYLTGSNFGAWSGTTYNQFGKEMKAEDVVRGVPADIKRFSWSLTAPSVPAGQTRQDTFIGRVYHEYKSSALGNIWVYTDTEAEASRTAGRQLYTPSFTYTRGPVGVQVRVSPDPIILYGTEDTFTLFIKLNNLGTGSIYTPAIANFYGRNNVGLQPNQLNNVTVSISASPLNIGAECLGFQELVAGRETTLVCDVTIPNAQLPQTFKSFSLNVDVFYGYYTEQTTSVMVQGK